MMSVGARVAAAIVVVQFLETGLNTLIKAENTNGMSNFVFIVYSNLLALFFLVPLTILYHRKRAPPPIPCSILCRVFILSFLSTAVQTLMYTGIGYSSPTLSSAMADLVPAFIFIFAIISRMENLNMKLRSSQAKVIGTVISVAGALIVTLYKGIPLTGGSMRNIVLSGSGTYLSVQSDWILGGFLLAMASLCLSLLIVVQMVGVGASVTAAMVATQFLEMGLNTMIKAANTNGMSNFVFIVYSNLLALFFLVPATFLYHRKRAPPSIPFSILCRMFLLSCLSTAVQTLMYTGIGYSSPTLSSAMVDLVPAFTFIFAIVSRMENLNLKLHSSQAKIIGAVISIAGALIVTLYKGIPLTGGSLRNIALGGSGTYVSVQSDWILGGLFLAVASLCLSLLLIVQTWIMKDYPEELVVATICSSIVVILSAIVTFFAEGNPRAWMVRSNKELIAVFYSAIFVISVRSVITAWACRKKGPVYVAMFNPLGMVIALGMGVIFLGESIYLGSMIGAATIGIGFYDVMWALAQENMVVNENNDLLTSSSAPLLSTKNMEV